MRLNSCLLTFLIFIHILSLVYGSTHWVVTENGRIQSQINSIYKMSRPYDLIDFIRQEERAQDFLSQYEEMTQRKQALHAQLSRLSSASDLEKNMYYSDDDCVAAKDAVYQQLSYNVIDYASDLLNIKQILPDGVTPVENVDLDCTKFSNLDFSMAYFPHLQVLTQTWNVSWPKETDISVPLSPGQLYYGLTKNKTSWHLYNLASLYFRSVGEGQKALDCVKRAVHFVSRDYKDTPLLNLGVMLQNAQCSAEAAILLHSSIDHAPHKVKGYFVLANVYTSLGDYNRSIACYDNVIKLNPKWHAAKKARQVVVCHNKIKMRLNQLQASLQDIINQLKDYKVVQQKLLKNQDEIISSHEPPKIPSFPHFFPGEKCFSQTPSEPGAVICNLVPDIDEFLQTVNIDAMSLQNLLNKVEAQAQKLSEQMPLPYNRIEDFKSVYKLAEDTGDFQIFIDDGKEELMSDGTYYTEPKLTRLKL